MKKSLKATKWPKRPMKQINSVKQMFKEFEYPDPVHEKDGKWYFSDEHWCDVYGPYSTRQIANKQCYLYALNLNRDLTDEEKARIIPLIKGLDNGNDSG